MADEKRVVSLLERTVPVPVLAEVIALVGLEPTNHCVKVGSPWKTLREDVILHTTHKLDGTKRYQRLVDKLKAMCHEEAQVEWGPRWTFSEERVREILSQFRALVTRLPPSVQHRTRAPALVPGGRLAVYRHLYDARVTLESVIEDLLKCQALWQERQHQNRVQHAEQGFCNQCWVPQSVKEVLQLRLVSRHWNEAVLACPRVWRTVQQRIYIMMSPAPVPVLTNASGREVLRHVVQPVLMRVRIRRLSRHLILHQLPGYSVRSWASQELQLAELREWHRAGVVPLPDEKEDREESNEIQTNLQATLDQTHVLQHQLEAMLALLNDIQGHPTETEPEPTPVHKSEEEDQDAEPAAKRPRRDAE